MIHEFAADNNKHVSIWKVGQKSPKTKIREELSSDEQRINRRQRRVHKSFIPFNIHNNKNEMQYAN